MEEQKNFASDQEEGSVEAWRFFRYVIAPMLVLIFLVLIYLAIK